MTHICASRLTIIVSDNGLSPGRRQAIIWINTGIVLIGPLGTNINEILIKIATFLLKKMYLKISSGKLWPLCLGLNMFICHLYDSLSCVDTEDRDTKFAWLFAMIFHWELHKTICSMCSTWLLIGIVFWWCHIHTIYITSWLLRTITRYLILPYVDGCPHIR